MEVALVMFCLGVLRFYVAATSKSNASEATAVMPRLSLIWNKVSNTIRLLVERHSLGFPHRLSCVDEEFLLRVCFFPHTDEAAHRYTLSPLRRVSHIFLVEARAQGASHSPPSA